MPGPDSASNSTIPSAVMMAQETKRVGRISQRYADDCALRIAGHTGFYGVHQTILFL